MSDEYEIKIGYTYSTEPKYDVSANFNIDELEKLMEEFRQKFDDDISRALFSSMPNPLLDVPEVKVYDSDKQFLHAMDYVPVRYSPYIPQGQGLVVYGNVFIGTGKQSVDKIIKQIVDLPRS